MVYLPSELWLQVLSYNDQPRDLWRNARRTSRQLRDCVEQHFKDNIVPNLKLELTFGLPCYDGRNPLRGMAKFEFSQFEGATQSEDTERIVCALVGVDPEHYMEQLLVRWNRLKESSGGYLPQSLDWSMSVTEKGDSVEVPRTGGTVRLKDPVAFSNDEKSVDGNGVVFEWKAATTSFFL